MNLWPIHGIYIYIFKKTNLDRLGQFRERDWSNYTGSGKIRLVTSLFPRQFWYQFLFLKENTTYWRFTKSTKIIKTSHHKQPLLVVFQQPQTSHQNAPCLFSFEEYLPARNSSQSTNWSMYQQDLGRRSWSFPGGKSQQKWIQLLLEKTRKSWDKFISL